MADKDRPNIPRFVAVVSCPQLAGTPDPKQTLMDALQQYGWAVEAVEWQPGADWPSYPFTPAKPKQEAE